MTATNHSSGHMILPPTRPLLIGAGTQLLIVASGLMAATLLLGSVTTVGWRSLVLAFSCYGLVATFVVLDLGRHAPHQSFGVANSVTLARAAIAALLWGIVGEMLFGNALDLDAELRWLVVIAATTGLCLDGVDGWIARRSGMASDFGADFDMEVDSLFVLALSSLVYATGTVGAWVLLHGLIRYLFVIGGLLWPTLATPLMPLWRRKVVCVVQVAVLIAVLAPILPMEATPVLCFGALMLLGYSFGADILWLTKRARRALP